MFIINYYYLLFNEVKNGSSMKIDLFHEMENVYNESIHRCI